jgi:hypothetical protein
VGGVVSAAAFTVTPTLVVRVVAPEVPVTVTVLFPVVAVPAPTRNVLVQLPLAGGVQELPDGQEQDKLEELQSSVKLTDELNPPVLCTVTVTSWVPPPWITETGPLLVREKSGVERLMVTVMGPRAV